MSQKNLYLVVGLGNPGNRYKNTRHNAGFRVVDAVADELSIPFDTKKFDALFGLGNIEENKVLLAKPMSFMNRSGIPIFRLANYFKISCEHILVVYDDIDLNIGRIKIIEKGGHGGHNGIRSLMDAFQRRDFMRLRIGVGRPEAKISVTGHVLGNFAKEENDIFDKITSKAKEAVITILCDGITIGMNNFNKKEVKV